MIYAGVDYSMTSPAICVWDDTDPFNIDHFKFYFATKVKKYDGRLTNNIHGEVIDSYSCDEERFWLLSEWAMWVLDTVDIVFLEGYSMGSRGKVFNIGENTGLLKNQLWLGNKEVYSLAPTTVKKHATGKGNADKNQMHDAFIEDQGYDLSDKIGCVSGKSPAADCIDAYFILKTGLNK